MDIIAIDTETGGFYPAIHALLSIGACCSWSGETFREWVTVESQPGKVVEQEAAEVNGYEEEKWEALGMPLVLAMQRLVTWIEERKKERRHAVLVCHNMEFDRSHLREGERVTGLVLPYRGDWRCSQVKLAELMDKGVIARGSASLDRLCELSGFEGRGAVHEAGGDALACLRGYLWLLEKEKGPVETLRRLYTTSLTARRALESMMAVDGWQPIETAPKEELPVLVYSPELVHEDFNPTGCCEGTYQDWGLEQEGGTHMVPVWDNDLDCFHVKFVTPTNWKPMLPPGSLEIQWKDGMARICVERMRQVLVEGYDAEVDDGYTRELLLAAQSYIMYVDARNADEALPPCFVPRFWPWPRELFKPSEDPVRNLEKAGALIAAEIDRLLRLRGAGSEQAGVPASHGAEAGTHHSESDEHCTAGKEGV